MCATVRSENLDGNLGELERERAAALERSLRPADREHGALLRAGRNVVREQQLTEMEPRREIEVARDRRHRVVRVREDDVQLVVVAQCSQAQAHVGRGAPFDHRLIIPVHRHRDDRAASELPVENRVEIGVDVAVSQSAASATERVGVMAPSAKMLASIALICTTAW